MIELGHDHDHVAEAGIDAVGVAIVGESAAVGAMKLEAAATASFGSKLE